MLIVDAWQNIDSTNLLVTLPFYIIHLITIFHFCSISTCIVLLFFIAYCCISLSCLSVCLFCICVCFYQKKSLLITLLKNLLLSPTQLRPKTRALVTISVAWLCSGGEETLSNSRSDNDPSDDGVQTQGCQEIHDTPQLRHSRCWAQSRFWARVGRLMLQ